MKTTDGGATWSPLFSQTTNTITCITFRDISNGWYAGDAGTAALTTDGGTTWHLKATGFNKTLLGVDFNGAEVYVCGVEGFAAKSTNSGGSWVVMDFKFDARSDVNDVCFAGSAIFFCGGGGFIRKSTDGAATFSHPLNPMLGDLRDVFFYDAGIGWAFSGKNNAILRTTDGGTTWLLPTGTTLTLSWSQKLSVTTTVRGNTFAINPFDRNIVYCVLGTSGYASYNRGETWLQIATMPSGGTKVNSFYVSPKDSNLWAAAYGAPDRIVRTTNRGASWTSTITINFTEYGMPLEMDGSHPDTLLFGPEDGKLWGSTNFGLTWDSLSIPGFRSPCDIVIVRDNPSVVLVGDGVTGSEIPTIGSSAIDNRLAFATAWGSGGVMKTTTADSGWTSVATTGSTWGVDIAKDDPNVVMYGVYSGSTSYLSTNAGSSFITASLPNANYALYCYDRGTFFAQQSSGIYTLNMTYTVPTVPVPIQLASFTARIVGGGDVLLECMTVSEVNNYGFVVQRRSESSSPFADVPNSFVPGNGTTNQPHFYSFVDTSASVGTWQYRLKQIDLDVTIHYTDSVQLTLLTTVEEPRVPTTYFLLQNYPNPFNPSTINRYGLPRPSNVVLEVFDALGQTVVRLVDAVQEPGIRYVVFDASGIEAPTGLASGVYVYRIDARDVTSGAMFVDSRKLLLIK